MRCFSASIFVIALTICVATYPISAKSGLPINPFEGMNDVEISFLTGGKLELDEYSANRSMFEGCRESRKVFEGAVVAALRPILKCAKIALVKLSDNKIEVSVFGRLESDDSGSRNIFLVEVNVYNPKIDSEEYFDLRPVIGAVKPDAVGGALVETVVGVVSEWVDSPPLIATRNGRLCSAAEQKSANAQRD